MRMDYKYVPADPLAPSKQATAEMLQHWWPAAAKSNAALTDRVAANASKPAAAAGAGGQPHVDSDDMAAWVVCAMQLSNILDFVKMANSWDEHSFQ